MALKIIVAVILSGIFLTGCITPPGPFETLDEYRGIFAEKKVSPLLPSGSVLLIA